MNRWPSWSDLAMDLVEGSGDVPVGMTFDASRDSLPRHRVSVVDPQADRLMAMPVVDVETFARTYREAETLAYDVEETFMGYPLSVSSGGRVVLVDRVEVLTSPAEIQLEGESKIRRFLATYQLVVRRG